MLGVKNLWNSPVKQTWVIWLYQLSWKCKLATGTSYKADVSSVSPSSVSISISDCDWYRVISIHSINYTWKITCIANSLSRLVYLRSLPFVDRFTSKLRSCLRMREWNTMTQRAQNLRLSRNNSLCNTAGSRTQNFVSIIDE